MRHQRPFLALFPLLLVSSAATAAAQGDVVAERSFFTPWPEPGTSLSFERAVPARFSDDGLLDLAVLRTHEGLLQAGYVANAHRFNHFAALSVTANDLAVLNGVAANGRDALVLAEPDRLAVLELDGAGEFQTIETLSGPAWSNASRVWSHADAQGTPWVFALDATGTSLARASWNALNGQLDVQSPIAVPLGLEDLVTLEYDGPTGAGSLELVFWYGRGIYVTKWDGQPLEFFDAAPYPEDLPTPSGARLGLVVSQGDDISPNPFERDLICVYAYWSVTGDFMVWSFNAEVVGATVVAEGVSAEQASLGLVAGDYDGDGFEDLLLPHVMGSSVSLLRRTNLDADPFERSGVLGDRVNLVHGADLSTDAIELLVACQVDEDADLDLMAFQGGNHGVHTFLSSASGPAAAPVECYVDLATLQTPNDGSPWSADLTVLLPEQWESLEPKPTHVHVEGWLQPSSTDLLNSSRAISVHLPLPAEPPTDEAMGALAWSGTGLDPNEFVLQLHVSLVELLGTETGQRYPSRVHHLVPSLSAEGMLQQALDFELTGSYDPGQGEGGTGSAHDAGGGDGNVSGNRGSGSRPKPPPSPNGT